VALTAIQIKRRVTGAAGAPASLKTAELAYNMVDGTIYVGYGDNGSGTATSVRPLARDDFAPGQRVPAGGAAGTMLYKASAADYDIAWTALTAAMIPSLDAGKITSGTFATALIPSLDASKITSGSFSVGQIPNLDASKVNTGTFTASQIPSLDASKINSGVLDISRIPILPSTIQEVSSGGIANLTTTQQSNIGDGSIVTTTDGRRWIYTGSGSKTSEASYIEVADVTPEWTVIANKPTFATVATSGAYSDLSGRPSLATVATTGSYTDLSNRPTLGSMASQNSNSVTITGGTIDNITLDGGTF